MDPMIRLIETVLREGMLGGQISDYLKSQAIWEAPMRRNLIKLVADFRTGVPDAVEDAQARLRELNYLYRARQAVAVLPVVSKIIIEEIGRRGWWEREPPHVLDCTDGERSTMISMIEETLRHIADTDTKRPYTLLTKFLHFCFPESFPISDSQAAASIQTWSYFAFEDCGPGWQQFSWRSIVMPDASGYNGTVEFYRLFWKTATDAHRKLLVSLAAQNEVMLGAQVTVLDLVDKMLWYANGDPLYMGLRCSEWLPVSYPFTAPGLDECGVA